MLLLLLLLRGFGVPLCWQARLHRLALGCQMDVTCVPSRKSNEVTCYWSQDHFRVLRDSARLKEPARRQCHTTRSPVGRVSKYNRCIRQCVSRFSQWLATAERRQCVRDKLIMAAACSGWATRGRPTSAVLPIHKATLLASRVCKARL